MKKHIFCGLLLSLPLYGMNISNNTGNVEAENKVDYMKIYKELMEAYEAHRVKKLQATTHNEDGFDSKVENREKIDAEFEAQIQKSRK